MKTLHFIEWFYYGAFVPESSALEVKARVAPKKILAKAFAYRFYDQTVAKTEAGEELRGDPKNFSIMTYFGTEYTAAEYMRLPECNEVSRDNIKTNGYKRLVKTKHGRVLPLYPKDKVAQ